MNQQRVPVMSIRVVHSGKVYRYPLDPEATCGSIKRQFARDSGLDVSGFRLKVRTHHCESHVLIDAEQLEQLMDRLIHLSQRRSNSFELREAPSRIDRQWEELREVLRDPTLTRAQANAALVRNFAEAVDRAALTRRVERIYDETLRNLEAPEHPAPQCSPWQRHETIAGPSASKSAHAAAAGLGPVLELRVENVSIVHYQPAGVVGADGQMTCTYTVINGCTLNVGHDETIGDLRRSLAQRLRTSEDQLRLRVAGEAAELEGEEETLVRLHRLGQRRVLNVERIGEAQATVAFDSRCSHLMRIRYDWPLGRLVEEIRRCAPALERVQFHLRTNGLILAVQSETRVGQVYLGEFPLQVVVDIDEAVPDVSPGPAPAATASIERVIDMNDFLTLQSKAFLDAHANTLGRLGLEEFVNGVAAEMTLEANVNTARPAPTSSGDFQQDCTPGQFTIFLRAPPRALRFISIQVVRAWTGEGFVLDRVTASTRLYTLRNRVCALTDQPPASQKLSIDGRVLKGKDKTLRQLGVLHGARVLLERSDDGDSNSSVEDD